MLKTASNLFSWSISFSFIDVVKFSLGANVSCFSACKTAYSCVTVRFVIYLCLKYTVYDIVFGPCFSDPYIVAVIVNSECYQVPPIDVLGCPWCSLVGVIMYLDGAPQFCHWNAI